jgi:hypothetical protein
MAMTSMVPGLGQVVVASGLCGAEAGAAHPSAARRRRRRASPHAVPPQSLRLRLARQPTPRSASSPACLEVHARARVCPYRLGGVLMSWYDTGAASSLTAAVSGELPPPVVTGDTLIDVRTNDSALRHCWVQPLPAQGRVDSAAALHAAALLNRAAALAPELHVEIPTFRPIPEAAHSRMQVYHVPRARARVYVCVCVCVCVCVYMYV